MAVHNALVSIGAPKEFTSIINDAENTKGLLWLNGTFGSHPDKLGLLFDQYRIAYKTTDKRENFNSMIYDGGTYIVSFWNQNMPWKGIHIVMFQARANGNINIYNNGGSFNTYETFLSLDEYLSRQDSAIVLYNIW